MIRNFRDKKTAALFGGVDVKKFRGFRAQAERRLIVLDSATSLRDLAALPSNKLHALKDDRKGQHAIWITGKWRICFVWKDDGAHEVEITDYH